MKDKIDYPFFLSEAFFIDIDFHRESEIPEGTPINFIAGYKVIDSALPDHFQVNLKVNTRGESPIKVDLIFVGLFKYNGISIEEDKGRISEYLNSVGLFILFPPVSQLLKSTTSIMGLNPITLPLPNNFEVITSNDEG